MLGKRRPARRRADTVCRERSETSGQPGGLGAQRVGCRTTFNHVSAAVGGERQQMPRHPTTINPHAGGNARALPLPW